MKKHRFQKILEDHGFYSFGCLGFPYKINVVGDPKSFRIYIKDSYFSLESLFCMYKLLTKTYRNKLIRGLHEGVSPVQRNDDAA